jgi:hypothetical protein
VMDDSKKQPRAVVDPSMLKSEEIQLVVQALAGLRFGSVTVIVQDGVIVQIDRTDKNRIRGADGRTSAKRQAPGD